MSQPSHFDFELWLGAATHGLRSETAAVVRAEYTNHYLDAMDEGLRRGLQPAEAGRQALQGLGPAEPVGRALRDVHLGRRRYQWSVALSLAIVAVQLAVPAFGEQLGLPEEAPAGRLLFALGEIGMAAMTLVVLSALYGLLAWRFNLQRLETPFRLIALGLVTEVGEVAMSRLLFGYSTFGEVQRTLFTAISPLDFLLALAGLGSRLALGAGLIWLAVRLWRERATLYGIGSLIVVLMALMGLGLAGTGPLVYTGSVPLWSLAAVTATAAHMLIWPFLALLFNRALARGSEQPIRYA